MLPISTQEAKLTVTTEAKLSGGHILDTNQREGSACVTAEKRLSHIHGEG